MGGGLKLLLRHNDLLAAVGVVVVVAMMLVPLPSALIDIFITVNISGALMILITTMYVPRALDFAAFPSLLLLTTLFRLGINISVTRLVLLHGDAGNVIHAFGSFVVGGNVLVGMVVFLILVVIQFVVITNGAGRVAEVAAGILIVAINLLGGIGVGLLQRGMSFSDAAHQFPILTIGDGLAAQIPALLISTAMGIIVTRSGSEADLGSDISAQILRQPRAPMIAGAIIAAMGLVPGMPIIPFLAIGTIF